jgi:ABC-type polysaccharide/polyol phosphate export permease
MLQNLVARELKSRYKGSVLGFLWTILTPLFMAIVYVFFLRLLARGVPMEKIIIGVFAWQFTAQAVNSGLTAITGNTNLVKKVFFPRIILPTATTLAQLVTYLFSLIIQLVLVAILLGIKGDVMQIWTLALPLLIIYHTLFNLSLAYLLSAANVYFRDAQHLVGVLLTAWFFSSPAMYDLSIVEKVAGTRPLLLKLYMLNPMAIIIGGYRALMLPDATLPLSAFTVAGALIPLILFIIARHVFERVQQNFADML